MGRPKAEQLSGFEEEWEDLGRFWGWLCLCSFWVLVSVAMLCQCPFGLLALVGEKGSEDEKESMDERWLVSESGLKKFEHESSKLLKVKLSQLMLSHLGHIHCTLLLPRRTYSAEPRSTHEWWYQIPHASQWMPLQDHVTCSSQKPHREMD